MSDEPIVTGEEPVAPPPEPTPEPIPEPTQEPMPAPEPDPEDKLIEKLEAKIKPWMGRREKSLEERFEERINKTVEMVLQRVGVPQQAYQPPVEDEFVREEKAKIFNYTQEYITKQQQDQAKYYQAVKSGVDTLIEQDPIIAENDELKKEIIDTAMTIQMKAGLPPDVQAELLISNAKNRVLEKKIMNKNAFSDKPKVTPPKTLEPKGTPPKKKVEIDTDLLAEGRKMFPDYDDEKLYNVLKDIA